MSSIMPGFGYDIFISYRQKDNKGDRWVSEFVNALKTELESTFKEEISVYFDINPHDGLLETHDVNDSLKEKLNCLVFIPIISQTYCDTKSFAWEHEFKAFVELASKDQLGLKVKLSNGNVASRVLPVRIHELDITDTKLCESIIGGALRCVDFIYKSAGVNRPLRSIEDKPQDNLNNTIFRDQINKVANALKEIFFGLNKEPILLVKENTQYRKPIEEVKKEEIRKVKVGLSKSFKRRFLSGGLIILILIAILLIYPKIFNGDDFKYLKSEELIEKVISFYDVYHEWDNYNGKVNLISYFPENETYLKEIIEIQTKEGSYKDSFISSGREIIMGIQNGDCFREIDSNKNPPEDLIKELGLECEHIHHLKEHHYSHFGLIMELKASGLILEKKVETIKFLGTDCFALMFTCDSSKVKNKYYNGKNITVYVDPSNYSMKGFKGTGVWDFYVVFSGILNVNGIKLPLCKTYFNNVDNSFLWVDLFTNVK